MPRIRSCAKARILNIRGVNVDIDFSTLTTQALRLPDFTDGMTIRCFGHTTPVTLVILGGIRGAFDVFNDGADTVHVKPPRVKVDVEPSVTTHFDTSGA